jgi:hypothetical protein
MFIARSRPAGPGYWISGISDATWTSIMLSIACSAWTHRAATIGDKAFSIFP